MDANRCSRQSIRAVSAGAALVALVLALLVAGPTRLGRNAAAQDDLALTPTPPATMNVSGHGAVTITPDTASVSLGVTIDGATLAEAQAETTARMDAIIAAVKAAGVEDPDIKTTQYRVDVLYDRDDDGNSTRVIIGYEVSHRLAVKVRDLASLGALLDSVVAEGATNVYGISFSVDDPSAAASQARQLAVEDAMRKAEELAAAAGVEIARVTFITESSAPRPAPRDFAGDAAAAAPAADVPIQAGSTELSVDVQMTFELRQQAG